jgi:hypothetical protein
MKIKFRRQSHFEAYSLSKAIRLVTTFPISHPKGKKENIDTLEDAYTPPQRRNLGFLMEEFHYRCQVIPFLWFPSLKSCNQAPYVPDLINSSIRYLREELPIGSLALENRLD